MSVEQRREALQALTKSDGEAGASQAGAASGRRQARPARGCAGDGGRRARLGSRLPPLRGPRDRRLGPLGRAVAISLQESRAHVQRLDQNADGASAQEGEVARPRARDDRGQKPGEDCGAARRSSDHRVPLAAPVPGAPADDKPRSLSGIVEADEIVDPDPSKAAGPTCRARRGSGAERPGIRAAIKTTFPSSSPATGRARPLTLYRRRTTTPRSPPCRPASLRRALLGDGRAVGRLRPPGRHSLHVVPRRESRPGAASHTTRFQAGQHGSRTSTASLTRTCQATSAGAALLEPGEVDTAQSRYVSPR